MVNDNTFQGHELTCNLVQFESAKRKLLRELIKCLSDMFEGDNTILKATFLANLRHWPKNIDDEPGITLRTFNHFIMIKFALTLKLSCGSL